MKSPDRLIGAALLSSVLVGAGSIVILWIVGRSGDTDWPLGPALEHPGWLVVGEVLGAAAWGITAASLAVLGVRHGGSSVLVALGVACLVISIAGVVLVLVLDIAYISKAQGQDGVLQAITFGLRWTWWNALGWLFFAGGGSLGLVALGIGLGRGNRSLRYPGMALAGSLVAMYLFPPAAILLAASLCWLALAVARSDLSLAGGSPQPAR